MEGSAPVNGATSSITGVRGWLELFAWESTIT